MANLIRLTAMVLLAICLLAAVVCLFTIEIGLGLGVATGSAVTGWLTYILLMGFAEMIDNTAEQARHSREILALLHHTNKGIPAEKGSSGERQGRKADDSASDDEMIACPACGMIQKKNRSVCWKCGVKFTKTEQE